MISSTVQFWSRLVVELRYVSVDASGMNKVEGQKETFFAMV